MSSKPKAYQVTEVEITDAEPPRNVGIAEFDSLDVASFRDAQGCPA